MDSNSYSRLLSYVVCETTMPIKKHVYNFAASDQSSMKTQLLSAACLIAQSQSQEYQVEMSNEELIPNHDQEVCDNPDQETNEQKRKKSLSKDDVQPAKKKSKKGSKKKNVEEQFLQCNETDFKAMFKVSRSTFEILVQILSEEELEPIEDVSLEKKVMIILSLLCNACSNEEAAEKFEVNVEAVTSVFYDICATLNNKSDTFIKWPMFDEADEIANKIEDKYGFPGVVGVLGCKYVAIPIPKDSTTRREHFNGKLRMYCVALQMVCDDDFIVRDIFAGLAGGIPPSKVLQESQLKEILTTDASQIVDPNKHILAGPEFPQLPSMLTPYKDSGTLSQEEIEVNAMHATVCLLVDETFKIIKNRFGILKLLDLDTASMVLYSVCVLHNICMQNGDKYDPQDYI